MEALTNSASSPDVLPSEREYSLPPVHAEATIAGSIQVGLSPISSMDTVETQTDPPSHNEPIAISIVSHSRLLREGLVPLLRHYLPVHRVGEYSEKTEPRDGLPNPPPHVVLVDSNIGSDSAYQWTKWWRSQSSPPAVLALELEDNKEVILACIEAGASGYTVKESSPREVAYAIELACKGHATCSPEITGYLFERLAAIKAMQSVPIAPDIPLTARELDVLACIAKGFSNKEIAASLTIEVHTVKHHVHSILDKLKVRHRQDAANFAANQDWFRTVLPRR